MRSSHSTQLATAKAISTHRDAMVGEWSAWLAGRPTTTAVPPEVMDRELHLILDTLVQMLGPLRREVAGVWRNVTEHYGRTGAARGLAAGEVVEELQQLRALLIKYIGADIAAMRPRRAVAVFLRLNAIIDRAISQAVVGYTDALVASLMMTDRQTGASLTDLSSEDLDRQIDGLEELLSGVTSGR